MDDNNFVLVLIFGLFRNEYNGLIMGDSIRIDNSLFIVIIGYCLQTVSSICVSFGVDVEEFKKNSDKMASKAF